MLILEVSDWLAQAAGLDRSPRRMASPTTQDGEEETAQDGEDDSETLAEKGDFGSCFALVFFFSLGSVPVHFPNLAPLHPLGGSLYLQSDPCRNHFASSMPACRSASLAAGYLAFMNAEFEICFCLSGERTAQLGSVLTTAGVCAAYLSLQLISKHVFYTVYIGKRLPPALTFCCMCISSKVSLAEATREVRDC